MRELSPNTTSVSPTKPKKGWKPKTVFESQQGGVPSMFASSALDKPLRVTRKSYKPTALKLQGLEAKKPTRNVVLSSTVVVPDSNTQCTDGAQCTKDAENAKTGMKASDEAVKERGSKTYQSIKGQTPLAIPDTLESSKTTSQYSSESTSTEAPRRFRTVSHKKYSQPAWNQRQDQEEQPLHKDIDDLIPEMYRKKSKAQEQQEQQEEERRRLQLLLWKLKRQEQEREEETLRQYQPIGADLDITLNKLRNGSSLNVATINKRKSGGDGLFRG